MKPKTGKPDDPGLLEYLEDIIGSYTYKEKIDALEEDYNRLFDSKREKTDITKISEKELENLESSKNAAIEYVKRERTVFKLLNVQHQLSRHIANREMMRNEAVIEEVGKRRKEEEKRMKEKIKDKENLLKNYKRKKEELEELKDVITGYEGKLVEFEKRDIKIRKDMEHQLSLEIKLEVFIFLFLSFSVFRYFFVGKNFHNFEFYHTESFLESN
jgi:structural maintenance of chromosome 4